VNQNYEGPRTPYGDPYHGYWMGDITKLNGRFGTADDLKSLVAELHRRDMQAIQPSSNIQLIYDTGILWWTLSSIT